MITQVGLGWEMGGRLRREGTCVYPWLIHIDVWQKPTLYCKAIILHLKINLKIAQEKKKTVNTHLTSRRISKTIKEILKREEEQ